MRSCLLPAGTKRRARSAFRTQIRSFSSQKIWALRSDQMRFCSSVALGGHCWVVRNCSIACRSGSSACLRAWEFVPRSKTLIMLGEVVLSSRGRSAVSLFLTTKLYSVWASKKRARVFLCRWPSSGTGCWSIRSTKLRPLRCSSKYSMP